MKFQNDGNIVNYSKKNGDGNQSFCVSLPVKDEIYRTREVISLLYRVLVFNSEALFRWLFLLVNLLYQAHLFLATPSRFCCLWKSKTHRDSEKHDDTS